MSKRTIRIRGGDYEVQAPRSVSEVIDVLRIADTSPHRAMAAAIGLAVPKVQRQCQVGTLRDHRYDAAAFGGSMYDALLAGGCTMDEVLQAGSVALEVISEVVPTQAEVDADVGFSEATA